MNAFIWKKYIDNLSPFLRIYLFQWMHVQKEPSFVPTWEYLLSHLGSSIIRQCHIIQYSSQRLANRSIECDVKWRHHFYAHGFVHRRWLSHCMVCVPYVGPHNLIVQRWTQSFEYHGFFVLQKEFSCAYSKPQMGQLIYSKFTLKIKKKLFPQLTTWIKKTHWILVVILQSPLIYMYQLWTLSEPWKVPFPSESTRIINSVGNWSISSIDTKHHRYRY